METRKCKYCGSTDYYAKGLCRNCIHRFYATGELDKSKRLKHETQVRNKIYKLKRELERIEKGKKLLADNDRPRSVEYYIYIQEYMMGKGYTEIAEKYEVTRQCVYGVINDTYQRGKRR